LLWALHIVTKQHFLHLLVETREIYMPQSSYAPSHRCLVLRKLGYHKLKKIWWYVKPFRYDTGTWQTDGQTDGQNCYRAI